MESDRMGENGLKFVGVPARVIPMLKKLQGDYQYKNGEKMSYGAIVEKLVAAEFAALGLELDEEKEEVEAIA